MLKNLKILRLKKKQKIKNIKAESKDLVRKRTY